MNAAARIAENLAAVRQRIADATARAGRPRDSGETGRGDKVCVEPQWRAMLVEAGCHDLGESRPQELWSKAEALNVGSSPTIRWHLIGHLQRNKVRAHAAGGFAGPYGR